MENYNLLFPLLGGGPEQGLNDAGVETFRGNHCAFLARECAQNSLDAAIDGQKVTLKFTYNQINRDEIPCIGDLENTLSLCKQYRSNKKEIQGFTEKALATIQKEKIGVLEISDFGTSGLSGSDDNIDSSWYGLTRSGGICNKTSEEAGGGFGIGKNAPFAASLVRTIFYSTKNTNDEYIFQGVSKLMTHKNNHNELTQGTGYIGKNIDNKISSVRDFARIPALFKRQEIGTTIYVIGFDAYEKWQEELFREILYNFFASIHFGKIDFDVCGEHINKDTLIKYVNQYANPECPLDKFIVCFSGDENTFEESLSDIGMCELRVAYGEDYPKLALMTRESRMLIDKYSPRIRKPYVALFSCVSKEGNQLLREMEPPRHDKWEVRNHENRLKEEKILRTIRNWIGKKIKEAMPQLTGDEFDLDDASQFFQTLDEADDGFPDAPEKKDASNNDGFNTKPSLRKIKVTTRAVIPKISQGEQLLLDDSAEGDEATNNDHTGTSKRGNGLGETGTGGGKAAGSSGPDRRVWFNPRMFPSDEQKNVLILRSPENFFGSVCCYSAGDEVDEKINIIEGADENGNILKISDGAIKDVSINAGIPAKFVIRLASNERIAIKVAGYEHTK